jgi:Flp pilus assembly protein TadB
VQQAAYTVLVVTHGLLGATWLGAMLYSLFVVQPRAARFFAGDDDAYEQWVVTLAAGNRWPVVALIAGIGVSGAALPFVDAGWSAVVLAKAVLLAVAAGVFWYVSWRHWPRRIFATEAERPALRRTLRRCAYALVACAGAASVLGLALSATARS